MKWWVVDGKPLLDLGKKAIYSSYTLANFGLSTMGSNGTAYITGDAFLPNGGGSTVANNEGYSFIQGEFIDRMPSSSRTRASVAKASAAAETLSVINNLLLAYSNKVEGDDLRGRYMLYEGDNGQRFVRSRRYGYTHVYHEWTGDYLYRFDPKGSDVPAYAVEHGLNCKWWDLTC